MTPMSRLLTCYEYADDETRAALASILSDYSQFIELLLHSNTRALLKSADSKQNADQRVQGLRERVEGIGDRLQTALEQVFLQDSRFGPLTRRYGLF
jgi:hypothetical protein